MNIDWTALLYGAGGSAIFGSFVYGSKLLRDFYTEHTSTTNQKFQRISTHLKELENDYPRYAIFTNTIKDEIRSLQFWSIRWVTLCIFCFTAVLLMEIGELITNKNESESIYLLIIIGIISFIRSMQKSIKASALDLLLRKESKRFLGFDFDV